VCGRAAPMEPAATGTSPDATNRARLPVVVGRGSPWSRWWIVRRHAAPATFDCPAGAHVPPHRIPLVPWEAEGRLARDGFDGRGPDRRSRRRGLFLGRTTRPVASAAGRDVFNCAGRVDCPGPSSEPDADRHANGDPDSDPHAWSGRVQRDWVDGGGP